MIPFRGHEFSGTTVRYEARGGKKWVENFSPTLVGEPFDRDSPNSRVLGTYRFEDEPKFGPALVYRWTPTASQLESPNDRRLFEWSFESEVLERLGFRSYNLIDSEDPNERHVVVAEAGLAWREWAEKQFLGHPPRAISDREWGLIDRIIQFRDPDWDTAQIEMWLSARIVVETLAGREEVILFAAKKPSLSVANVAAAMYLRALEVGRPKSALEVEDTHISRPAANTPTIFRFAPSRGAD